MRTNIRLTIVHVEVVLHHPTLGQLQVPAIVLFVSDGGQNTGWLSCLQDDDQLVGPSMAKVRLDKVIATTFGSFQDGGIPFLGSVLYRILKLFGDVPQQVPTHGVLIPIGAEESNHALRLLKGLYETVQQNSVEAAISESNAILVMLVESVHGKLLCGEIPGA